VITFSCLVRIVVFLLTNALGVVLGLLYDSCIRHINLVRCIASGTIFPASLGNRLSIAGGLLCRAVDLASSSLPGIHRPDIVFPTSTVPTSILPVTVAGTLSHRYLSYRLPVSELPSAGNMSPSTRYSFFRCLPFTGTRFIVYRYLSYRLPVSELPSAGI
jgi:hypothetical protein